MDSWVRRLAAAFRQSRQRDPPGRTAARIHEPSGTDTYREAKQHDLRPRARPESDFEGQRMAAIFPMSVDSAEGGNLKTTTNLHSFFQKDRQSHDGL